jgi:CRP/FNR family transcriptional regulator, cyclic AMP receptor protein
MASKKAMLEHLRNVPLFSGCSTKDLEKIAKAGDTITLPAGSVIIDQGQTGREAFVIIDGQATVRRNGKKITTVGAGAVLGELSLLDHGPRTATVVCDTECSVIVIDQRHFSGVLAEVPAIAQKLLASLAARIRDFDRQYYG